MQLKKKGLFTFLKYYLVMLFSQLAGAAIGIMALIGIGNLLDWLESVTKTGNARNLVNVFLIVLFLSILTVFITFIKNNKDKFVMTISTFESLKNVLEFSCMLFVFSALGAFTVSVGYSLAYFFGVL